MASSKKSLTEKFAMEAKQKSPGKKSKKTSKASKSLSRELAKAPASPSTSKRAQKSHSDSLVVGTKDVSPSRTDKASEPTGAISKVLQKKDDVIKKVKGKKDGKQVTKPSSRDCSPAKSQTHAIEKLETSLEATWYKPEDSDMADNLSTVTSFEEYLPPVTSSTSGSINTLSSTAEWSSLSSSIISSTDRSAITESISSSSTGDGTLSSSDVFITTTATVSPIPLAHSTDSLASEMESYKLGMARSSGSFSSDIETVKFDDSVIEPGGINISECSSTSTPVRFSIHADHDKDVHVKRAPRFSLIRDATIHNANRNFFTASFSRPSFSGPKISDEKHRTDELSDDGELPKYRELSETDELEVYSHSHFVPLNKQLQIVTSMDRIMDR